MREFSYFPWRFGSFDDDFSETERGSLSVVDILGIDGCNLPFKRFRMTHGLPYPNHTRSRNLWHTHVHGPRHGRHWVGKGQNVTPSSYQYAKEKLANLKYHQTLMIKHQFTSSQSDKSQDVPTAHTKGCLRVQLIRGAHHYGELFCKTPHFGLFACMQHRA